MSTNTITLKFSAESHEYALTVHDGGMVAISRDGVLRAVAQWQDGEVVFANPAAAALFTDDEIGFFENELFEGTIREQIQRSMAAAHPFNWE